MCIGAGSIVSFRTPQALTQTYGQRSAAACPISVMMTSRCFFVHSHQEAGAIVQSPTDAWKILGNAAVDELVRLAALEVRLEASVRSRLMQLECDVSLIRHRLLRAAFECVRAGASAQ
eukprot:3474712-Pyramimonas_sp.AAC.1